MAVGEQVPQGHKKNEGVLGSIGGVEGRTD